MAPGAETGTITARDPGTITTTALSPGTTAMTWDRHTGAETGDVVELSPPRRSSGGPGRSVGVRS
jgi:hypothetical protein